ncbi:MAG: isochorismatase family protein [Neisseriaceae bacterium]
MSIVAIEVDVQQTFSSLCPDELPVNGVLEIVSELNYQAQLADFRVLSKEAHGPSGLWRVDTRAEMGQCTGHSDADLTWVAHAEVGTQGFDVLPGLPRPEEYDFLIYKGVESHLHPYGSCYHDLQEHTSTGLIEWLHFKKTRLILLGGLTMEYCVKHTALQLLRASKTWKVVVNLAACRGLDHETSNMALLEMKRAGGIEVNSREELLREVGRTRYLASRAL